RPHRPRRRRAGGDRARGATHPLRGALQPAAARLGAGPGLHRSARHRAPSGPALRADPPGGGPGLRSPRRAARARNRLTAFEATCDFHEGFGRTAPGGRPGSRRMFSPARGGRGANEMTKSELIDAIAGRGELTKARAELVVNCIFDAMAETLQRGDGIEIRGFGSFTVRPYKPYNGRNPRTGQTVPVPAKRLPFFKVGKELKELVNNSRHHAISGGDDDDDTDD